MNGNLEESREQFRQVEEWLNVARRNARIAERLYSELHDAQPEAQLHLYRGWLALANAQLLSKGAERGDRTDSIFVRETLEPPVDEKGRERWSETLEELERSAKAVLTQDAPVLPIELLEHHFVLLSKAERKLRREVYAAHGIASPLVRSLRMVGGALLLLLIGFGVYHLLQGPDPWRVALYSNPTVSGAPEQIISAREIDFEWTQNGPVLGFGNTNYSARFESCLVLEGGATVAFKAGSDDGTRLDVGGNRVIDKWRPSAYTFESANVTLPAGSHLLQLDYFQLGGGAQVSLSITVDGKPLTASGVATLTRPEILPNGRAQCHN